MLLKFNLKASGQRLLKVLDELAPLSSWLRELETHFSARANVKIRRLFSVSQNQGSPCLINFHLLGQRLRQSHWILGRLQLQIASDMYLFEICASSSDWSQRPCNSLVGWTARPSLHSEARCLCLDQIWLLKASWRYSYGLPRRCRPGIDWSPVSFGWLRTRARQACKATHYPRVDSKLDLWLWRCLWAYTRSFGGQPRDC